MSADQAAGLRLRQRQQLPHCIHCFVDTPESTRQLARALHQQGHRCLLIDWQGRLFADSSMRSLFDWKQQIERGRLNTLPHPDGDVWYAPGVRANEPDLRRLAQAYDLLLFDCAPTPLALDIMPDARITLVADVQASHASRLHVYALLKTLSALLSGQVDVHLRGDALACAQVRAACGHFLNAAFADAVTCTAGELDANSVLAVRMANGGTGVVAC